MTEVIDPPVEPAQEPKKRRRKVSFWIGLALVLAGLGILAWLAWDIWGTTWISQRAERKEVCQFVAAPSSGPSALLEIPALGSGNGTGCGSTFGSNFVVPVNDMPPAPADASSVLSKGVGHFTGTGPGYSTIAPGSLAPDGTAGNYALAGHRITHGQPFAGLPNLRPGDLVYVITHSRTYEYVLDTNPNSLVVPFTAGWVLGMDPVNPSGGTEAPQGPGDVFGAPRYWNRIITLTTCSELFHTDNRMIAFGHLVTSFPTDLAKARSYPAKLAH